MSAEANGSDEGGRAAVAFLSGDLMFAGRVRGACEAGDAVFYFGSDLPTDAQAAELAGTLRLVILDLGTRGGLTESLVPQVRERFPQARVIAYASHVHKARLQAASEAGFDAVLTRGQFDAWLSRLPETLGS